ncbi:hypothetical protein [Paenibacillus agricola]|uniref:Uncharacterized protein n=1 Tax=Paenibacillus agricola TaxID=2716264 RepID=A0ABX0JK36_9BACL|nr:hypothetical protein [Paenibacillus agricola]NHN34346.1 hypothetical protein [Paenibacillus agricola]
MNRNIPEKNRDIMVSVCNICYKAGHLSVVRKRVSDLKKKWLLTIGGTLLLLLFFGYIGMNVAVSYVLHAFSSGKVSDPDVSNPRGVKQETNLKAQPPVNEGNSGIPSASPKENTPGIPEPQKTVQVNHSNGQTSVATSSTGSAPAALVQIQTDAAEKKPNTESTDPFKYEAQISPDKAKAVEHSITMKEKADITSLLLKTLSSSDIQMFMKMASDGMSVTEKKEAKKLLLQKLSEDEYNHLVSIVAKYGLSQGKNYQESMKEQTVGK